MNMPCIIHIDMDAFYASIEQRDNPKLRGKPVIVGGDPNQRGVVATCSYEARKFGIHSAMSSVRAKRKCPQGVFVRPRFDVYKRVSQQIREIFLYYTPIIEPLSLDEAYLDVSSLLPVRGSGNLIAKDIKQRIHRETGLTASAGVSYNKLLAKIGSDKDKPDGLFYISEKEGPDFVKSLRIREFFGIGPATEERLHAYGIYTGADLLTWTLDELQPIFGKSASFYYDAARAIDRRPVEAHRERKSVSVEDTFKQDLDKVDDMLAMLNKQCETLITDCARIGVVGKTVTLKVKFNDFSQVTRSISCASYFTASSELYSLIPQLLESARVKDLPIRLLGVAVSNLSTIDDANWRQQMPLL
jgi:DNA polymerase-4